MDRLTGYHEAMAAAGLRVDPAWEVIGDFTVRGGLAATRLLLAADPRPTAVFAASDEMAVGRGARLREAGLRVPEDVSVIGIDDHEMAEFFELTTVAQPVHEQGQLAATLLLEALDEDVGQRTRPPAIIVPDPARRPAYDGAAVRPEPAQRPWLATALIASAAASGSRY